MSAKISKYTTILGTLFCIWFICYLITSDCLTDPVKMQALISSFGVFAPIFFLFLQVIQVIVPIIPGGISSGIGILLFGPFWGFILNYLSILLGCMILFYMVRTYGKTFILRFTDKKIYDKYIGWLDKGKLFDRFFAFAILIPGMPDDLLCMIASLTRISFSKYMMINILCRPFSLIAYSWGIKEVILRLGILISS